MLLENKVAVVTGGSRGIGLATVKAFLQEGAAVVLCASRQETADRAVAELKAELPDAVVEGICPNLADAAAVQTAIDAVAAKYGRIDILVNNAGMSESTPFANYTEELFDKTMDLNVKGVFNCSHAAAKWMAEQHSGVILNTSSVVSITGQTAGVAYPTSKFAVNGFTLTLARELGPQGIRVNAIAPGITETDMMKAVPKEIIDPPCSADPPAPSGSAGGHRQCAGVPCLGEGVLHHRRRAERGRPGPRLISF